MKILNLTQHTATQEQVAQGVYEPQNKKAIQALITFIKAPSKEEMIDRAIQLACIMDAEGATSCMIGGAPYFQGTLERVLKEFGFQPLYSFTERKVVETTNEKGEVVKTAIFSHVGWVEV